HVAAAWSSSCPRRRHRATSEGRRTLGCMLVAHGTRWPKIRLGAVAAIGITVGAATWVIVVGPSNHGNAPPRAAQPASVPRTQPPRIVSTAALRAFARSQQGPVYWAGLKSRTRFELTAGGNGRVYVRYLQPGVAAGSPRADFLTVGTYAQTDA